MMFYRETEFQETSIGRIPKDWHVVRLEDASLLITDGSHFSPEHQNSGYPLATVANMRENYIDIDSCYRISREDFERLAESRDKPEINDVLFSKDGTVGRCIVFNQKVDLIVLSSVAIIRPDMERADPYFLKYMLQSRSVLNRVAGSKTGTAIRRIVLRDLSMVRLSLPKRIDEQKKIVEVLGVVDSAIELADKVVAKTERLKKGLMQQLLTRGIGNTEYKDTPIGKIPREWNVITLGDVCDQRNEMFQPSGNNTYTFVGLEHITSGETKVRTYAQDASVKSSKFKFYPEDILYGKLRPYLDKAVLVDFDGICSTDLLVLKTKKDVSREFLVYIIHSKEFIEHAISTTSGTNYPRTSWRLIGKFKFGLPKAAEQQRIAETLSVIDRKLEVEKAEKSKLERIKLGLMDLLLTGKVGVKVD